MSYDTDLAYIHDQGFGGFARGAAPGILALLRAAKINEGRIVDLGCGSGIWAKALLEAGFHVTGLDHSPAMIEIAQRRAPEAEFHIGSFSRFCIPPCRAVTALGEVFNYLFDADDSEGSIDIVCKNAFDALLPAGCLIFDVAVAGRCRGRHQAFMEGDDWTCLVEFRHDEPNLRLTRRIVTFRKIGDSYRRQEETHRQQLFEEARVVHLLESIGFRVKILRAYGDYKLPEVVIAYMATKM